MPQKWFRVPNGTPPELERFVDNPGDLEGYVQEVLSRAQQYQDAPIELLDVYFEVGSGREAATPSKKRRQAARSPLRRSPPP